MACLVTYHLKDFLKVEGVDVETAMISFGSNRSFETVRAVALAAKHTKATVGKKYPDNIPFNAGEDYERPPAIAGLAVAGLSRVGDWTGGREIAWHLGGLDLYDCVKTVLENYYFYFSQFFEGVDFRDC